MAMAIQASLRNFTAAALLAAFLCTPSWSRPRRVRRPLVLRMEATAYAENAKLTAAGTIPHEGIVAADPAVLPLNTRIRVSRAGAYNGIYNVRDTGSKIAGRHIDLCVPSAEQAKQFGKKTVVVHVLKVGDGKPVTQAPAGHPMLH